MTPTIALTAEHDERPPLCGLAVDGDGTVHLAEALGGGPRAQAAGTLRPFAWLTDPAAAAAAAAGAQVEPLGGSAPFGWLAHFAGGQEQRELARAQAGVDAPGSPESQFLLQNRRRLFTGLTFGQLRRCQLDIETASGDEGFSDARQASDYVLAIGLQCDGRRHLLVLRERSDEAERELLGEFGRVLQAEDPDVIEGHNIFKFDLDYLRQRCRRHQMPCAWGRFGRPAVWRNSRLKLAERLIDFPRCDLPGRAVVDTYFLVLLHDLSAREMQSHTLKESARHFGVTPESGAGRTYLAGDRIAAAYEHDRGQFLAYLADDLRETAGLADRLLPTFVEQARTFPITLQDAVLRGTTAKIDLLFLEHYYHARQGIPAPGQVAPFEGGFTRSFREGVFSRVLHFDVASLYPSLLLLIGRPPAGDTLGVFVPLLRQLRNYRLRYKGLARSEPDPERRREYAARQASYKLLINSFYGYLGFEGARFGDGALAAEVTGRGRDLLRELLARLEAAGCLPLEADTDGIYVQAEAHFGEPEALLARLREGLPEGIELEFDGRYEAMFCYKAKNYALREGDEVTVRGSALRSRGVEPFLRRLSDHIVRHLLGLAARPPAELAAELRAALQAGRLPIGEVAKSEVLGVSPEAYRRQMEAGGKPRRAAAEVALQMTPVPRLGERVTYFISPRARGRTADWQCARPVAHWSAGVNPYDSSYYVEKLDDLLDRFAPFLGRDALRPGQQELF